MIEEARGKTREGNVFRRNIVFEEDTEGSVRGTRKRKRRKEGKWKRKEVD